MDGEFDHRHEELRGVAKTYSPWERQKLEVGWDTDQIWSKDAQRQVQFIGKSNGRETDYTWPQMFI